ncbi:MAG: hypothetical protein M3O35_20730 [Acidobacteriota bacterium]|nr:hypothetical protein [Acidobacteriota bacterium]
METDRFQLAADELLDRVTEDHLDPAREAQSQLEREPSRPREDNYAQVRQERDGYNRGGMARQQASAILTNKRINASYLERTAQAGEERQDSREALEQRVEQSQSHGADQPAEHSRTTTREAQPEQSQEQEPDWQRYAQDKEYRAQVDGREKSQQQTQQQRKATVQRDREH